MQYHTSFFQLTYHQCCNTMSLSVLSQSCNSPGILPVEVNALKSKLPELGDGGVDEDGPLDGVLGHDGVLAGAGIPSANREDGAEVGVPGKKLKMDDLNILIFF